MDRLRMLRARIDEIDGRMAELFAERMAAASEIAAWKKERGLPVRDSAREREILSRAGERIADPSLEKHYLALLECLMSESRAYQTERMAEDPALLRVRTRQSAYPVYLRRGCLSRAGELLELERRVFLVTDSGVPAAYADRLAAQCRAPRIFRVPAGEQSKSPAVLTELLSAMLAFGLTRGDCVAALGGGVVGDLAGLAAALYMRGVDLYLIPSTLLSMVDSSVGGKTAVDLCGVKNAVGAFYPPRAVLLDPELLSTLPPRQLANGLAEVLKMALTHDAALFARFEDPQGFGPVEELIASALRIKASVVERDERESDLRRVLNFGHTLGHGIEAASDGRLLHGECVALGMIPMCAPEVRARLIPVLERLGLPTHADFDPDAALAAIAHDKKISSDGGVRVVSVPSPGSFSFETVTPGALREKLELLHCEEKEADV